MTKRQSTEGIVRKDARKDDQKKRDFANKIQKTKKQSYKVTNKLSGDAINCKREKIEKT